VSFPASHPGAPARRTETCVASPTVTPHSEPTHGLSLAPFRATRFTAPAESLGLRFSPPYDVVSDKDRAALVASAETNVVRLILPDADEAALGGGNRYAGAKALLDDWVADGTLAVDPQPALFVYEMTTPDGGVTRGLVGAVELRDPDDGVILPHENTMAGPVSDRLSLMMATEANLEPIYLVYDGGGAASEAVAVASENDPLVETHGTDRVMHRLWAITDPRTLAAIDRDLGHRHALIADGHHRYATYRQLQADHGGAPGPWDRGLALLVDTSSYGPQVHPIHRVVSMAWDTILAATRASGSVSEVMSVSEAEKVLSDSESFALVLAQRDRAVVVTGVSEDAMRAGLGEDAGSTLGRLDVTVLHRVLVEKVWGLTDTVETVGYAHDVEESLRAAGTDRTAILMRPTPVRAVADVAAAGARMPRKSTLFTPKPASGVVLRRFADQ